MAEEQQTQEQPKIEVEQVKETKRKVEGKTGIAYIYSSYNNTIVHITDLSGQTISQVSGGKATKQSRLKATPTVAMFVAKRAAEIARDHGIDSLYVRVHGKTRAPSLRPGSHSAIKTLSKEGIKIINILDTTRIPRGGPKQKGGKRGRRV